MTKYINAVLTEFFDFFSGFLCFGFLFLWSIFMIGVPIYFIYRMAELLEIIK